MEGLEAANKVLEGRRVWGKGIGGVDTWHKVGVSGVIIIEINGVRNHAWGERFPDLGVNTKHLLVTLKQQLETNRLQVLPEWAQQHVGRIQGLRRDRFTECPST
jgi:hypothetical protein